MKPSEVKDRTQKDCDEMDFNEYHTWATAYVLFGIGEGRSLRELMFNLLSGTTQNKVFGGAKPK